MKNIYLSLLFTFCSLFAFAQGKKPLQSIRLDSGLKIIVYDDYTWKYWGMCPSEDRLFITKMESESRPVVDDTSDSIAISNPTPQKSYSSPEPTYNGGEVQVKGYYRKNGTYVQPHTRSAPRRR